MPEQAHFIEIFSTARARTDLEFDEKQPAIVITVRPKPDRSWEFKNIGLTIAQARRLRDDLVNLLKAPVF
jgi:hypothetical protein